MVCFEFSLFIIRLLLLVCLLLDSKTNSTTFTKFSQYLVVFAREPASFWRENVIWPFLY